MVNKLIEQYKKEFRELFAERKAKKAKASVFSVMSRLDDIEAQLEANTLQKEMLDEKKEKLEAELTALAGGQ